MLKSVVVVVSCVAEVDVACAATAVSGFAIFKGIWITGEFYFKLLQAT